MIYNSMANTFPTGVLRWTGDWINSTTYKYGDIALASTNVSYACGAVTSLNVDPATQPSTDWFPFPPSGGGGGGVTSLSGIQGVITQSCVNGTYTVVDNNIVLTITYPTPPISSFTVTPESGLANTGSSTAIVLESTIRTTEIQTGLIPVDGTEVVLWVSNFTPQGAGGACTTTISFDIKANSFADDSTTCGLELFYYETGSPFKQTLGSISFFRPVGSVGQIIGFNASYNRVISTLTNTSYTLELQGTSSSLTIGNPWTVASTGFIQTGLPAS